MQINDETFREGAGQRSGKGLPEKLLHIMNKQENFKNPGMSR